MHKVSKQILRLRPLSLIMIGIFVLGSQAEAGFSFFSKNKCGQLFEAKQNSEAAFPEKSESEIIQASGHFNYYITQRNISALSWLVRNLAYIARNEARPLQVAEISNGIPMTALPFVDGGNLREYGDMLHYISASGKNPFEKSEQNISVRLSEAHATRATVFTPVDMTRKLLETGLARQVDADGYFQKSLMGWFYREIPNSNLYFSKWSTPETLAAISEGYRKTILRQKLKVYEGDIASSLRTAIQEGRRFDILFVHDMAWYSNRVKLLELIQNSLAPMGRAIIPLKWWAPKTEGGGVDQFIHWQDTIQTDKDQMKLQDFLVLNYPDAFEIGKESGVEYLIVKGTLKPIEMPTLIGTITTETVRFGFKSMQWQLEPKKTKGWWN